MNERSLLLARSSPAHEDVPQSCTQANSPLQAKILKTPATKTVCFNPAHRLTPLYSELVGHYSCTSSKACFPHRTPEAQPEKAKRRAVRLSEPERRWSSLANERG